MISAGDAAYGGSATARSKAASAPGPRSRNRCTWSQTSSPPGSATAARLARMTRAARGSDSTNTTRTAPRDSASRPIAPEPANRSRTLAPGSGPRIAVTVANSPSLARSLVGRVAIPVGAASRRPPAIPAMIRITVRFPRGTASCLLEELGLLLVEQRADRRGERLALPALLQVQPRQPEPVQRGRHGIQPVPGPGPPGRLGDEQAQARLT